MIYAMKRGSSRWSLFLCQIIAGIFFGSSSCAFGVENSPPNVVFIFTDDQGYADLGCFGGKGLRTPHLDAMAAAGRKMTRHYVSSPVCSASRAALLTGCLHSRVSIHSALMPDSPVGLHPQEETLAELLKTRGYRTALIGKWHLGRPEALLPTAHGFDRYFGIPYSNDMWPHNSAAQPPFPPLPLIEGTQVIETIDEQTTLLHRHTEKAVSFIKDSADQPFFLFFTPFLPHVPLSARPQFRHDQNDESLYASVLEEIDAAVGQILTTLDELKLADKTLVVFTSDNGPWLSYGSHAGSAGALREGKTTIWEGGIRVPCIARWPGKIPAGTSSAEPVMTIDWLPTIASLSGAALPQKKIDGRNIWPLLNGENKAKSPHEFLPIYYAQNHLQAIISGPWKLVLPHTYPSVTDQPRATGGIRGTTRQITVNEPELYQLEDDPSEKNNLAAKEPAVLARLQDYAKKIRADLGDRGAPGPGVRPAIGKN
jgi:arylsulfatase A